jgi:hypothetical protein
MFMRDLRLCGFLAIASLSTGLVASCLEGADIAISDCLNPVPGHLDSHGYLDPCCKDDESPCRGGQDACDICMPSASVVDWEQTPVLLWHGPSVNEIPKCPDDAATFDILGRDPIPPSTCRPCECSDPSCVLPEGLIADGAAGCVQGPFTLFPPEADGSCSNKASIDPNQLQSIAILPPTVSKCVGSRAPVSVPREFPINSTGWSTVALVCNGAGAGFCNESDRHMCFRPAPSDFARCVQRKQPDVEDTPCPPGYPYHHVYYKEHDSSIECSPCECSPPVGSVCTAAVTAYTNNACTDDGAIFKDFIVSQGPPPCVNVQPNTGLKGLTEAWIINQPGKCSPSLSEPTGKAAPLHASAQEFCCADPDFPDPIFEQ